MADITMCSNKQCKKRKSCYRVTAKVNTFMQSYSRFIPDIYGKCKYYLENR